MSDNTATLEGYTLEIHARADNGTELFLLIKPNTNVDGTFHAWDMDAQEFITVNGWLFVIKPVY